VEHLQLHGLEMKGQDMLTSVTAADCVAIITDHDGVDYQGVVENSKLIVDTRNALKKFKSEKIIRL
jgi:UDP-N-acetyl-D-glucosamine dehydrogenase